MGTCDFMSALGAWRQGLSPKEPRGTSPLSYRNRSVVDGSTWVAGTHQMAQTCWRQLRFIGRGHPRTRPQHQRPRQPVATPRPNPHPSRGTSRSTSTTWRLNLLAVLRQMPQARWQCLNFSGTGHQLSCPGEGCEGTAPLSWGSQGRSGHLGGPASTFGLQFRRSLALARPMRAGVGCAASGATPRPKPPSASPTPPESPTFGVGVLCGQ